MAIFYVFIIVIGNCTDKKIGKTPYIENENMGVYCINKCIMSSGVTPDDTQVCNKLFQTEKPCERGLIIETSGVPCTFDRVRINQYHEK